MVLVGLPWVGEPIWPVQDAHCVDKKPDAALLNQLLMAYQLAMGLLFLKTLYQFHERNALVTARLARMVSFAIELTSKPRVCHTAIP